MESESLPDLSSIVAQTFNRRNAEVDTNAQLRKRVAAKFADQVSTKGGCEAAVHAARRYLSDGVGKGVLLKIDMRNAFNCLHRDTFLSAARSRVPGLYSRVERF